MFENVGRDEEDGGEFRLDLMGAYLFAFDVPCDFRSESGPERTRKEGDRMAAQD